MNKAFFIDRDGVIVVEKNYLAKPEDVEIIPGVANALKQIKKAGYMAVVVSNQSGIARGYYDDKAVDAINAKITELLAAEGAALDAFYHCPHHPDFSGHCECRKPAPGMLLLAAGELDIDIAASFMIGDKVSDVRAGENAGCRRSVMIETGHGKAELQRKKPQDIIVAPDFEHAVKLLLNMV